MSLTYDFHPPTLIKRANKGGKYYVCVTKPKALQLGSYKQIMRSTGTTDERIAKTKKFAIAQQIYEEFDRQLSAIHSNYLARRDTLLKTTSITDSMGVYTALAPSLHQLGLDKDPMQPILKLLPKWIAHLEETSQGNQKERSSRQSKLEEFSSIVGNLPVQNIEKKHAYQYAKWLNDRGKANKTIRSLVTKVSAFLTWCEQTGKIDSSPFHNLTLTHYGRDSVSYLPFEPEELMQIFAQEVKVQDRLCLTLLATTGARLDEIALLHWEQVKTEFGITYIDLRPNHIRVKTDGSHRIIPIHSEVVPKLKPGKGRLFDYPIDRNGKAQNSTSRRLMPYIRSVTNDSRKVLHSFRATFKQNLENAGVTPEITQQLEAGEISFTEVEKAMADNKVDKRVNDKLTGHSSRDVAGKYGFGPLLLPRAHAIEKLDVSFLNLDAFCE